MGVALDSHEIAAVRAKREPDCFAERIRSVSQESLVPGHSSRVGEGDKIIYMVPR
jgi:hypothetical protein